MKQRNQFATEEEYLEYLKQPKPFFSYDPQGDFDLHATAEEAENAAKAILESYQEEAADSGWSDSVTDVCWGVLKGEVVCTKTVLREQAVIDDEGYDDENGVMWSDEWDELWYHDLIPVESPSPLENALMEMIDAFPLMTSPRQTSAKIRALKALGWKQGENGLLIDPRK